MQTKPGVYGFTHVRLHEATAAYIECLYELDAEMGEAITSCQDGVHARQSDHWDGRALDYRIWILPESKWKKLETMMKQKLSPKKDWFVLLEPERLHLHVSFRGKTEVIR